MSLSPTGTVPLDIALVIMMGCVRALASLHRLGYVHRQVQIVLLGTALDY